MRYAYNKMMGKESRAHKRIVKKKRGKTGHVSTCQGSQRNIRVARKQERLMVLNLAERSRKIMNGKCPWIWQLGAHGLRTFSRTV